MIIVAVTRFVARELTAGEFCDKLTAFGAQLIGQRDERLSLIGFAPKALRLSSSIEPTPFGLRSARSVGTENCINAISAPNRRRLISLPVGH